MPTDWENIEIRPAEKPPVPARLLPGRFPLLWILLPLIAGYLAGQAAINISDNFVWSVGASACLLSLVSAWQSGANSRVWSVAFLLGVFSLGLLFHRFACPAPPDRSELPPREAILSIRVDELFNSRFDAVSGVGVVTGAASHLAELENSRIQFRVTKHDRNPAFDLGATVRLRGVLDNAPSGDGFARYLRQRGIPFTLSRAKLEAVESPASSFRQACTRARERVADALSRGVDSAGAVRLAALMLGRTSLLPQGERNDFQKAGATHLFAISGLHITGIAAGLLWAARRLRMSDALSLPIILGALWLYVQMAGAPPSAMRAWVMAAAMFGASVLNRGARPAAGLVFAATLTLLLEPAALRDPGFLLSYVVVAAILLYAVPAARELEARIHPWRLIPPDSLGWWRRKILDSRQAVFSACATTFAATLAGAPLVAALFGNVAPVGLVANLALVPLAAPPVISGFVASALGAAGLPAWAVPFNKFGAFFMELLAAGAHLAARVPGGAWRVSVSAPWAVALSGGVVIATLLAYPVRPDKSSWRYAILPATVAAVFGVFVVFG